MIAVEGADKAKRVPTKVLQHMTVESEDSDNREAEAKAEGLKRRRWRRAQEN